MSVMHAPHSKTNRPNIYQKAAGSMELAADKQGGTVALFLPPTPNTSSLVKSKACRYSPDRELEVPDMEVSGPQTSKTPQER